VSILALTLIGLLGIPAVAAAADFCIDVQSGALTIVLKSFVLPTRGMCKLVQGFYIGPAYLTGVACGSSDNTRIRFDLQSNVGGVLITDSFALSRTSPTTPVLGTDCWSDGTHCFSTISYAKKTCSPAVVPVPG
jgi:hypothetical protein